MFDKSPVTWPFYIDNYTKGTTNVLFSALPLEGKDTKAAWACTRRLTTRERKRGHVGNSCSPCGALEGNTVKKLVKWAPLMWLLMCSFNYFSSTLTPKGLTSVALCLNWTPVGQPVYCLAFPWWFTPLHGLELQFSAQVTSKTTNISMHFVGVQPHSPFQVP